MASISSGSYVPFKITSVSSSDLNATARDLEKNSQIGASIADFPGNLNSNATNGLRLSHGWQSAPFCTYPQQLILELEGYSFSLCQLQFLIHHFKIASSLDLYYSLQSSLVPESCYWNKLGYVLLDDNEKSGWMAREIKCVYLEELGIVGCKALKIVLWDPHRNELNPEQQVGLVAVKILGHRENAAGMVVKGIEMDSPASSSAATSELVDAWITRLEQLKMEALSREDFHAAKQIKSGQGYILSVGREISQLTARKNSAVQLENYDEALSLKMQLTQMTRLVESRLASEFGIVRNLRSGALELRKESALGTAYEEDEEEANAVAGAVQKESALDLGRSSFSNNNNNNSSVEIINGNLGSSNLSFLKKSVVDIGNESSSNSASIKLPTNYHDPNEDRPLPTSLSSNMSLTGGLEASESSNNALDTKNGGDADDVLSEPLKQEYKAAIKEFGLVQMKSLLSPNGPFKDRENALNSILKQLLASPGAGSPEPGSLAIAASLFDPREKLVKIARDIYDCLLTKGAYDELLKAQHQQIGEGVEDEASVGETAKRTFTIIETGWVPQLLLKSCRTASVSENMSHFCSQWLLSLLTNFSHYPYSLIPGITKTSSRVTSPSLLKSRIDILSLYIEQEGIPSHSGLMLDSVVKNLLVPAWNHSNLEVRESSIALTALLYHQYGEPAFEPYFGEMKVSLKSKIKERASGIGVPGDRKSKSKKVPTGPARAKGTAVVQNTIETSPSKNAVLLTSKSQKERPPSRSSPVLKAESPKATAAAKSSKGANTSESSSSSPLKGAEAQLPSSAFCIFCEERNPLFDESPDHLDQHYYRECPMLISCPLCHLLKEVIHLQDHMLFDCEERFQVKQCPSCHEAILVKEYNRHVDACPDRNIHHEAHKLHPSEQTTTTEGVHGAHPKHQFQVDFVKCPLCHDRIYDGEVGFKRHLLVEGCQGGSHLKQKRKPKPNYDYVNHVWKK